MPHRSRLTGCDFQVERALRTRLFHRGYQHLTHFYGKVGGGSQFFGRAQAKASHNYDLALHLEVRTARDANEVLVLSARRTAPSAMLLAIQTPARRSWLECPYSSSRGKSAVNR